MKMVYAAVANDGLVKIGSSNNPKHRLRRLDSRGKLKLAYVSKAREDGRRIESIAHRLLALAGKHVAGEWFRASLDDVECAIVVAERIADGHELPLMYRGPLLRAQGEFVASKPIPSRLGKVLLAIWTDPELRKAVRIAAEKSGTGVTKFIEEALHDKLIIKRETEGPSPCRHSPSWTIPAIPGLRSTPPTPQKSPRPKSSSMP